MNKMRVQSVAEEEEEEEKNTLVVRYIQALFLFRFIYYFKRKLPLILTHNTT